MKSSLSDAAGNVIRTAVAKEYEWILSEEGAYGSWISGLWGEYEELHTFQETKEAFFVLIERLLQNGHIVFFPPQAFFLDGKFNTPTRSCVGRDDVWDVSDQELLEYIRTHFPETATTADSPEITDFWYSDYCPRVGWIDKANGCIIAS